MTERSPGHRRRSSTASPASVSSMVFNHSWTVTRAASRSASRRILGGPRVPARQLGASGRRRHRRHRSGSGSGEPCRILMRKDTCPVASNAEGEGFRPPLRSSTWTRPALPRRPKTFVCQLLRAQPAEKFRDDRFRWHPGPPLDAPDFSPADRASLPDRPESLDDAGYPPHDPKGGQRLSVTAV